MLLCFAGRTSDLLGKRLSTVAVKNGISNSLQILQVPLSPRSYYQIPPDDVITTCKWVACHYHTEVNTITVIINRSAPDSEKMDVFAYAHGLRNPMAEEWIC
jgi:hypothetical protein